MKFQPFLITDGSYQLYKRLIIFTARNDNYNRSLAL